MNKLVELTISQALSFFVFFTSLYFHGQHPKISTQMFLVTAYTPDSGDGISGSGAMASGKLSYVGAAACPMRLKKGTRIVLTGPARQKAERLGLPWDLICEDRFRNVYREGIDINLPKDYLGLSDKARIRLAYQFGVVRSSALVYVN